MAMPNSCPGRSAPPCSASLRFPLNWRKQALRPAGGDEMPKLPVVERRYLVAFALTSTLFFSWGLASQFNDLLLHHFQKALDLTRTRASLTQFAFYIAYFCAPLPAAMIIRRIGYKRTMVVGLTMYAIGAFLFVPAAHMRVYGIFLTALYIIAF